MNSISNLLFAIEHAKLFWSAVLAEGANFYSSLDTPDSGFTSAEWQGAVRYLQLFPHNNLQANGLSVELHLQQRRQASIKYRQYNAVHLHLYNSTGLPTQQ